jgi:hypothetical protein
VTRADPSTFLRPRFVLIKTIAVRATVRGPVIVPGRRGLQFFNRGIEVTLPTPVDRVDLDLGKFSADFTVDAYDVRGKLVVSVTIAAPNTFQFQQLFGPEILNLRFLGGGNEAIIAELCIVV